MTHKKERKLYVAKPFVLFFLDYLYVVIYFVIFLSFINLYETVGV